MKKEEVKSIKQIEPATNEKAESPKFKKTFTLRMVMLIIAGGITIAGAIMFAIYFKTQNVTVGGPSILMIGGGIILFKYYWGKADDVAIQHLGAVNKKQVNSMNLYPKKIGFEDLLEPEGFPWQCLNDKKYYFVNIMDEATNRLIPFVLPDQQYYDPGVFAERVLELPAHQKIFARKPSLFQKMKTGLLVIAIGIVWLLILTTTGG